MFLNELAKELSKMFGCVFSSVELRDYTENLQAGQRAYFSYDNKSISIQKSALGGEVFSLEVK